MPDQAGRGDPAGEGSRERWMVWSMREATNTRTILALTSTTSSHSRKMQQPSLRAMLITYLAFSSRSCGVVPAVTMARSMQRGSTAASKSTCSARGASQGWGALQQVGEVNLT